MITMHVYVNTGLCLNHSTIQLLSSSIQEVVNIMRMTELSQKVKQHFIPNDWCQLHEFQFPFSSIKI